MADDDASKDRRRPPEAGCAPCAGTPAAVVDVLDPWASLAPAELDRVRRCALAAAAELGATGEVRVRIVHDTEMAAAHVRYKGVEGTTDVLTFDLSSSGREARCEAGERTLDVDVLVCVDVARREAEQRGHGVVGELVLYVVHAMLHCLGMDDGDAASASAMHAREDRVLERIGLGTVFARGPAEAGASDDEACPCR